MDRKGSAVVGAFEWKTRKLPPNREIDQKPNEMRECYAVDPGLRGTVFVAFPILPYQ